MRDDDYPFTERKNSLGPNRRRIQNLSKSLYEKKPVMQGEDDYPDSEDSDPRKKLMEDLIPIR